MSTLTRTVALFSLTGLLWTVADIGWGKEIHFTARDVEGDKAVWHTDTVLLEHEEISGSGELVFVLNNPTAMEHAFVMPGVHLITRERILTPEQSVDIPATIRIPYVEPLALTIKPGESKRIRVNATDFLGVKAVGKAFRFFCTIHKDIHQSGSLYAM
ncbi:MAG: hypothetical protein C4293_03455 [Nitrospiraceae bacterium]